jgi:fructose-bisphosphate aldolase class I
VNRFEEQMQKVRTGQGFIAALDQSGGSTPKALRGYGLRNEEWSSDEEMFDLVHQMRTRIITSPAFSGDRLIGAILFENTMDREVGGEPSGDYLWQVKGVVPFLKVDRGLAEEKDGVQLMKPIPDLDQVLERAKAKNMFGTKMRSVIKRADPKGIAAIVRQQVDIGRRIIAAGLVPILEPEVDIHSPEKAQAEELLRAELRKKLDQLGPNEIVMLKLTLPEEDNLYLNLIEHPNVLKVVALSGGYSRAEANRRLAGHRGMVASFSRALVEGLSADQTDDEFNATLDASVESTYEASRT